MSPTRHVTNDPPGLVSYFIIHASRGWKMQELERHMLSMDVEATKQCLMSYVPQEDFWAWQYEKS